MKKTQVKKLQVKTLQTLSTTQLKQVVGGKGAQGQNRVLHGGPTGGYSTQTC